MSTVTLSRQFAFLYLHQYDSTGSFEHFSMRASHPIFDISKTTYIRDGMTMLQSVDVKKY
jgi:hypothetical protein